jgi:hypothetical protein
METLALGFVLFLIPLHVFGEQHGSNIYKDTTNPKYRLFLKIYQYGIWRQMYICLYMLSTQHENPSPPLLHTL